MLRPLAFEPETEAAVCFVEDTSPAKIVAGTVARLRAGETPESLVRAAALAVTRSTELPADHHGGPIHPVAGLHAVVNLARRLNGDRTLLPAIQAVALANLHIHSPEMGPALMGELDSSGGEVSAQNLAGQLAGHEEAETRPSPAWPSPVESGSASGGGRRVGGLTSHHRGSSAGGGRSRPG